MKEKKKKIKKKEKMGMEIIKVVKEGYKINPTKENKHLSNVKIHHI